MRPWVRVRAETTPDAPAIISPGKVLSWRALAQEAEEVARGLRAAGARPGDTVAVLLENGPAFVALVHAAPLARITLVPLNLRQLATELAYPIAEAGVTLVVHGDGALAERAEAASTGSRAQCVPAAHLSKLSRGGPPSQLFDAIALSAPAAIVYTSGTTGRPKGAVLSYGSFFWSAIGSAFHLGSLPTDRWFACMPLYHVGGLSILFRSVLGGSAVVLHERFNPEAAARALDEHRITLTSFIPTMLQRLLDARGEKRAPDTLRAVLIGGGAAPGQLLERAARLGFPVLPTYGLTEAASQVATLPPGTPLRPDGGGLRPLPGTEVRIIAEDGATLPPGVAGEIVVRGSTLMSGYFGRRDDTNRALAGGWLHTADVGLLEDSGALRVLDRRSDLVVSGGENVYPAAVEEALLANPNVCDAGVAGIPDSDLGWRVTAWVVLRPGVRPDAANLERFLRARLAGYALPRAWRFVDALPRDALGKLVRSELPGLRSRKPELAPPARV